VILCKSAANIEARGKTMNPSQIVQEINDRTFNFRIPMALKKALTDRSQSTGEKPSAIVREAIRNYLEAS